MKISMASPFPKSSSAPGEGLLVVQLLPNSISGLSTVMYQYPLKIVSPSPSPARKSALVFLLTYGGGLVGGDRVHLQIRNEPRTKLSIVTQGYTKVFKSASRDVVTRQELEVTIESDAALCLLPDPVQPFEGSVYMQSQIFTLAERSSVCLLDWVSNGRPARGEDWDFHSWRSTNEIWAAGVTDDKARLILRDNIFLQGDSVDQSDMELKKKMHGLGLFGTLILKGPLVESLASFFMIEFALLPRIGAREADPVGGEENVMEMPDQISWRSQRLEKETEDGVLWSAAKIRGCTVVKFGARNVEGGRTWIGSMIKKEGSVQQNFGDDAILCIR